MKYLLDTCVISELIKKKPDNNVIECLSKLNELNIFISVLTIGEIHKGISKINDSERKNSLLNWVNNDLVKRFENRIIDLDLSILIKWGQVNGEYEKKGVKLPVIDSLLVSTCLINNMIFVTRNVDDIKILECKYLNPWVKI